MTFRRVYQQTPIYISTLDRFLDIYQKLRSATAKYNFCRKRLSFSCISHFFVVPLQAQMKRRVSVIVFLLTALAAVIGSSVISGSQDRVENRATIPAPQQVSYVVSTSDCAIPVQIEKIQLTVIHLSARQQLKRLSQSVFGLPANIATTCSIKRTICRSRTLLRSLESFDISFPFSAFW